MEKTNSKICTRFTDNFCPQVLNHGECDLETLNASEYFVPEKKFDHVWAHELLANKCYKDYVPPIEISCKQTTERKTKIITEEEIEQLPYREANSNILPLDQQLAIIQQDVDIRQKLANDFANRTFPWYIQRPSYPLDFKITDEIKAVFKDHFEFEILQNIQHFRCNLLIIDLAHAASLQNLECWLKFSSYASIVTVIHDVELYEKVKNSLCILKLIFMNENVENTWQEELQRSINMGIIHAKEQFLLDDTNKPVAFIFSHNRGICVCDTFKILRKFLRIN